MILSKVLEGFKKLSVFQKVILATLLAGVIGSGLFTFAYGEGLSYISSDPKACANCHIMQPRLDSWEKSSHHAYATCVDCHLPSEFAFKWFSKADNGFFHSYAFTLQNFHEPIQIKPRNSRILQDNCVRCHEGVLHKAVPGLELTIENMNCVKCHVTVGHGERVDLGKAIIE
ncbi:MAG: cytochrome c nitrite reductase small subunit [Lentisphaeria bacterium]|nr:cytochrome c nitrite reductase small subunit [Lentisphaeria bacterium]